MDIGVDRHLFSRHRIEREPGGNFGHALRTGGDDDELNGHEDRKDDKSDDEVSPYDERSECRNDRADGARRAPDVRMRRVAETSSESRKSVASSSAGAKAENSSGSSTVTESKSTSADPNS